MILLRTGLSDGIFHLKLFACLTKQFIYSRSLHSGSWNLCHREGNNAPVPSALMDLYTWCQIHRPHFSGAHPPPATVSLEMCHTGNRRQDVECFNICTVARAKRIVRSLAGLSRSCFHSTWLQLSTCMKKNQSNTFPFWSAQGQIITLANFPLH